MTQRNWTCDARGRSNSSKAFNDACDAVERIIRSDAHALISGNSGSTARLIVAQLAHGHGFAPRDELAQIVEDQHMRTPIGADDAHHLRTIRGHLEIVREILSRATIDATFGEEAIASSIGWLNAYLGDMTADEWDESYNAMVEAVNEGRP